MKFPQKIWNLDTSYLPCCIWYTWWQTCLHNTWHNKCHVLWGWRILCQLDCDMCNKRNIFRAIVESCIPFSSFLQKWNRKNVSFFKVCFYSFRIFFLYSLSGLPISSFWRKSWKNNLIKVSFEVIVLFRKNWGHFTK